MKEASERIEIVPPVYKAVKIHVQSEEVQEVVPAVYETVIEKNLVREAYSTWKPGTQTAIQKLDPTTGEIMCLVEVPAECQNVTRQVLKTPGSVRYEDFPAECQTVRKTVAKIPATTRTVQIPAEYADVPQEFLVCPTQEYWTQLLCDENTAPVKVAEIQNALKAAGFDPGSSNGELDIPTMKAVRDYQKARELPQDGFLNIQTVRALGVSPN